MKIKPTETASPLVCVAFDFMSMETLKTFSLSNPEACFNRKEKETSEMMDISEY